MGRMKAKPILKIVKRIWKKIVVSLVFSLIASSFLVLISTSQNYKTVVETLQQKVKTNEELLKNTQIELDLLLDEDQYKINQELKENISETESAYKSAVSSYENLLKLKNQLNNTEKYDDLFTKALVQLSALNYDDAKQTLSDLNKGIREEQDKIATAATSKVTAPENNAPPSTGYSRQYVNSEAGRFLVSMVAADIGSTRIIVDTASDGDCGNECPVLPLATYVSRNGAYAGINGSYFCPASYPSCSGKTNSFDLLAMNHKKTYFNSGNNVYSNNPVVIFGDGYIRFVGSGSEWGRDTSPNGVLMNYPLLLMGGNVRFGGDDDPKKGSRGNRSFVANKGNTAYIGVVHSATVAQSARVMKTLGMENAINLDNGGSTALWSGGYKVGPGRNLPNVILFVKK